MNFRPLKMFNFVFGEINNHGLHNGYLNFEPKNKSTFRYKSWVGRENICWVPTANKSEPHLFRVDNLEAWL